MTKKIPTRGRPKTLDRQQILEVAMMSYWTDGPTEVSINEICKRAGVSKPGLYREFGSEDGLKQAVISAYASQMVGQLTELLNSNLSFSETLQALSSPILADQEEGQSEPPTQAVPVPVQLQLPKGCLFVEMCNCMDQLGSLTTAKVEEFQKQSLALFESWIDRVKSDGQFKQDFATPTAALYIYEQLSNSRSQQKRGVPARDIAAILALAFSVFE